MTNKSHTWQRNIVTWADTPMKKTSPFFTTQCWQLCTSATIRKESNGGMLLKLSSICMHGVFIVLSLAKGNIDVHVEKGASYYKQYYNQQPEN